MGKPGEVCQSCHEQPPSNSYMSQNDKDNHGPRNPVKALQIEYHLHAGGVFRSPWDD